MTDEKPDEKTEPTKMHLAEMPMTRLCVDFIQSPEGIALIHRRVAELCDKAVQEVLRNYGPFQQKLESLIERVLELPADMDVASYNETLLNIVRTKMAVLVEGSAQKQVGDDLMKLLAPAPAEIKLSTLLEQYVESLKPDDDDGCVCYGDDDQASWYYYKDPKYDSFSYLELSEGQAKKGEAEMTIGFSHMRGSDVHIYTLRFRNVIDELRLFVGPFHDFQRSLLQMKVGKTKIILDSDELDNVDLYHGPDRDR